MSDRPARTASSTTYWIAGLSTRGSISFGWAFVAGRNRVPSPAAGMTAFFNRMTAPSPRKCQVYAWRRCHRERFRRDLRLFGQWLLLVAGGGHHPVATGALGPVQGTVRRAQQVVRVAAVGGVGRHADADGQRDGVPVRAERRVVHD